MSVCAQQPSTRAATIDVWPLPLQLPAGTLHSLRRTLADDELRRAEPVHWAPGRVDTPMTQAFVRAAGTEGASPRFSKDGQSIGWFADAPDIAEVVVWLASAGARFINGATVVADGGLLAKMAD